MSRIAELHARLGLDVSAFVKGAASMSDSLKTAILKNQAALDKMDARFSRTFLGYVQGSTKAFSTYGIERLIAKFNALSEAQKLAFTEAGTRAEQATILNPDRGMSPAALARAQFNSAEFDTAQQRRIAQDTATRMQFEETVKQKRLAAEAELTQAQIDGANRVAAMRKERADEQAAYEARAGVENITTRLAAIRKAHQESKRGPESLGAIASDVGDLFDEKQVAVQKSLVAGQAQLVGLEKHSDALADSTKEHLKHQANAILNQIDPKREMVALQARLNAMVAAGHLKEGEARAFLAQQTRFQAGSRAASRYGLIMQQAGYQAQDFAVQVTGGTNAMVAFSQQASQMLGFFGAGGAIAGAVISTGILAYRMGTISANADAAAQKTRTLAAAVKLFNDELQRGRELRGEVKTVQSVEMELKIAKARKEAADAELKRAARLQEYYAKIAGGVNPLGRLVGSIAIWSGGFEEAARNASEATAEVVRIQNDLVEKNRDVGKAAGESAKAQIDALQMVRDAEKTRAQLGMTEYEKLLELRSRIGELQRGGVTPMDENYQQMLNREAEMTLSFGQQAEGIKDQLDPMRERNRLQERLNQLVAEGADVLTREQADRYLLNQAFKDLKAPQDLGSADSYARRGMVIGSGGHSTSRLEQTVTEEMKKISNSLAELLRTTKDRL